MNVMPITDFKFAVYVSALQTSKFSKYMRYNNESHTWWNDNALTQLKRGEMAA